jgi:cytochrome c oxidase subunit II
LEVDKDLIMPRDLVGLILVTSHDVLHSWTLPALGIKIDAVPGRINAGFIIADREGVYYGQCSELCGIRHAYMPITCRVVDFI